MVQERHNIDFMIRVVYVTGKGANHFFGRLTEAMEYYDKMKADRATASVTLLAATWEHITCWHKPEWVIEGELPEVEVGGAGTPA